MTYETIREMPYFSIYNGIAIIGDGNCLFRCFEHLNINRGRFALFKYRPGYEHLNIGNWTAAEFRQAACDFLDRNWECMNASHQVEDDKADYIPRMRENHAWGTNMEIEAIAILLGIQVIGHRENGNTIDPNNPLGPNGIVHLLHGSRGM